MWTVAWQLWPAGFIISPKSVLKPQRELDFVGKQLQPRAGKLANQPETLAAALRAWLKALARRHVWEKPRLSTLGKVNWADRPS